MLILLQLSLIPDEVLISYYSRLVTGSQRVQMKLAAWGRYPQIESKPIHFSSEEALAVLLREGKKELIAFGNGRSYGDSALAEHHCPMLGYNRMLDFDASVGLLTCEAGVLLSDIIDAFLPKGWFLKITPGTKQITVGGAVASDVHGKNHHLEGCFSACVDSLDLMIQDGSVLRCSEMQNSDLFRATCGGMGLTGIILRVSFYLKRVSSKNINQTTIKTKNLQETFDAFERYSHLPYSVAWIDCLAPSKNLGRCLLMVGEFSEDGDLDYREKKKLSIPFLFPGFALNSLAVKLFNKLYYAKAKEGVSHQVVDVDAFFYPLDAIDNWNRIYGKNGFTQYQFILPKEMSYEGLEEILTAISRSGKGSFLAVLKLYGPANDNFISFPMEGYSLALDFKIEPGLFALLDFLDEIVVKHGGRIYLTKDVRVSQEIFEVGYPEGIEPFRELRQKDGMSEKFNSFQSKRLSL
jgi:FAD/FMN-containing dehydrogenase